MTLVITDYVCFVQDPGDIFLNPDSLAQFGMIDRDAFDAVVSVPPLHHSFSFFSFSVSHCT